MTVQTKYKNVFVLTTGRSGSQTFAKACMNFANYSAGHETRTKYLGPERLNYPSSHIEVDNRLSWLLGRLEETFGDEPLYVHLTRNFEEVVKSYNSRWDKRGGITTAYANGMVWAGSPNERIVADMVDTINSNIRSFLKDKTHTMTVALENASEAFPQFMDQIGAAGNLESALATFSVRHNSGMQVDASDVSNDAPASALSVLTTLQAAAHKVNQLSRQVGTLAEKRRAKVNSIVDLAETRILKRKDVNELVKVSVAKHMERIRRSLKSYTAIADNKLDGLKTDSKELNHQLAFLTRHKQRKRAVISNNGGFHATNIVFVWRDVSQIGGIPGRLRRTVENAKGPTKYYSLSAQHSNTLEHPNHLLESALAYNEMAILGFTPENTVFVYQNNSQINISKSARALISQFPTIHIYAGQMAWFVQDSPFIGDNRYIDDYYVNSLITFSHLDANVQRQFGIHGQHVLPPPIETAERNSYSIHHDRVPGYVGRIDYPTKGSDILIELAQIMGERGNQKLRLFTTSEKNSPNYDHFMSFVERHNFQDLMEITLNITNKMEIFSKISVLLLPSRKESFGNVILEAFSQGVPVIAPSYCPGPSEIISHGINGLLLDDFSAESVYEALSNLTSADLQNMSHEAFARHLDFSMEDYYSKLEKIAAEAISNHFNGITFQVYPKLRAFQGKLNSKTE